MTPLTGLVMAVTLAVSSLADPADPVGVWPLRPEPEVVRPFDPPDSPYGAGHRGVDLLGRAGQPVLAALAGTVSYAGRLAGRGVVVVDHGATRTTYEPVTATVAVGTPVAAGSDVGTLEVPGSHCFPRACLHWGWIEGETYLDPLRLVGAGPMRLLPLWPDDALAAIRAPPPPVYSISRTGSPPMFASHVVMSAREPPAVKVTCTANQHPPRVDGSQV
jgi:murein DD-endopeptidase MepM/ murein hydrolase activator NlpD